VIRSMTGFGEASTSVDGTQYAIEVRSLNGKYFKSTIRLAEDYQSLEPVLEAELRRRLVRGTITLIAKISEQTGDAALSINAEALSRYIEQIRAVPALADGMGVIDAGSLLSLPGVLQPSADDESRHQRAQDAFLGILAKACDRVIEMRRKEGKLLVEDLLKHHDVIVTRLDRIAERAPTVVQDYETRLRSRIDALLKEAKIHVEPVELIREVAVYAEKTDIAEEIARLTGHMGQFKELITTEYTEPVGRTLDFLAQEMLREANTIASKCSDADISRDIVEVKGAIDRIKEQVQNAE